jgi:hypothetical protein
MRQLAKSLITLALLVIGVNACLAQDRSSKTPHQTASPNSSLPRNYRMWIAQYVYERFPHEILDAKITAPYETSRGLFRGGTVTAVCVMITRESIFRMLVKQYWVFREYKGEFRRFDPSTDSCTPATPFPELMRMLPSRRLVPARTPD